jgi:hypothetical protein
MILSFVFILAVCSHFSLVMHMGMNFFWVGVQRHFIELSVQFNSNIFQSVSVVEQRYYKKTNIKCLVSFQIENKVHKMFDC